MTLTNTQESYAFYARMAMPKELNLTKGLEKSFSIRDEFSIFIQVCEDGDALYTSINKLIGEEEVNLFVANRFLSVEDTKYVVNDIVKPSSETTLSDEESEKLDGIVYYVTKILFKDALNSLLSLSGLSVKNTEKKFVWLNTLDGFTQTWKEGDFGFRNLDEYLLELSLEDPRRDKSTWKLIEYTCHNDHDFEFDSHMKLR